MAVWALFKEWVNFVQHKQERGCVQEQFKGGNYKCIQENTVIHRHHYPLDTVQLGGVGVGLVWRADPPVIAHVHER